MFYSIGADLHVDVQHSAAEQIQSSIRGVLARKSLGGSKLKQGLVFKEIKERRQSCAHVLPKPLTPDRNSVGEGFETGPDMGVGSKKKEEGSFNFMRESLGQRRQSKESEVKVKAGSRVSRTSGTEKRGDINGLKNGQRKETTKGLPRPPPTVKNTVGVSSTGKDYNGVTSASLSKSVNSVGPSKFLTLHKISIDETMLTLKEEMNVLKGRDNITEEEYLEAAKVCIEQRREILGGIWESLNEEIQKRKFK